MEIFSVEDIQDLRDNPSDHTKLKVVDKLVRTLDYEQLTADERQIAEQILRLLAADISTRIRISVSEKFCNNNILPHDIALKLANDIEDFVAIPMIQFSQILHDADLLEIIANRGPERQSAVARREALNETLNQALIVTAAPEAIETLLENENAQLSPAQTGMILQRFKDNENVLKQLISNNHISLEQAHDLIARVSDELRKVIILKYEIPASTVGNLVQGSREWVILSMLQTHADKSKKSLPLRQIVDKLHREGSLNLTIILKSLTYGDFEFFCGAISLLSKVPEKNIEALIEIGSEAAVEGILKKSNFPVSMAKPVTKLLEIVKEEKKKNLDIPTLEKNIIQRLSKAAEEKSVEHIGHLVTILTHYSRL